MTRTLAPPEGWEQFADAKRLEATIWSDLPEQNWLVLSIRQGADGHRTVEELVIETTTTASPCGAQLEALVQKLSEEFKVRPVEVQT